jgi:hypothetical protein
MIKIEIVEAVSCVEVLFSQPSSLVITVIALGSKKRDSFFLGNHKALPIIDDHMNYNIENFTTRQVHVLLFKVCQ